MLRQLPPDLQRVLDSVSLTFCLEKFLVDDTPAVQSWSVVAIAHHWDDPGEGETPREETVAHMNLVKGSLIYQGLYDQLDAIEGDLETVAGAVLDREDGDLLPELDERLNGALGSELLILNSVVLSDRWRGYGVGALLAGEALLAIDGDAQCIATYPAPLSGVEGDERKKAIRKLERVWAQLGFEHFNNGVWVLDPGMVHLQDAVTRMRKNFHLG